MKDPVRENFEAKASCHARRLEGMKVFDRGSFLLVDSGLPSDTFNVIVARDLSDPRFLFEEGVDYFNARNFPCAVWHWSDGDEADCLLDFGLEANETDIAMQWGPGGRDFEAPVPPGFEIRPVESGSGMSVFGGVLSGLFGEPGEGNAVASYYEILARRNPSEFPEMRCFVGYADGIAVATGTLFQAGEIAGIYDIATAPGHRLKGFGSAMFARLLAEARLAGSRRVVLQASADGIGIYLRAGFKPSGKVRVFENRSLLEQKS